MGAFAILRQAARARALLVAALVGTALALSGCSAADPTRTTLRVWLDRTSADALADAITRFERDNDADVEVSVHDAATIDSDVRKAATSTAGPDVALVSHVGIAAMIRAGSAAEISRVRATAFEPISALSVIDDEAGLRALPMSFASVALYRNTELAPRASATFDELVATGEQLVDDGDAEVPLSVPIAVSSTASSTASSAAGGCDPVPLVALQNSLGAPVFGAAEDGTDNPDDVRLGSPGGVAFAEKLADWGSSGVLGTAVDVKQALSAFTGGDSPYLIGGPSLLDSVQASDVRYEIGAIPPAGPEQSRPYVTVRGLVIGSFTTNALLADRLVYDYLGTDDAQLALAAATDRPPASLAAQARLSDDPDVVALADVARFGVLEPSISAMSDVRAEWGLTECALIDGSSDDPSAEWTEMVDRITQAIAE